VNGLALCAGIGGFELGLRLVFPEYRTVCFVERDAFAAATLVARMADEAMDRAPIWDDLTTFDGRAWRGVVDIVTAGFPCQPWSQAGAKRGTDDERWLWPAIWGIIRDVGPSLVVLENVPGLISGGGLGIVLGDLAEGGYDARWRCIRAADIGAPHLRDRVFILAYAGGVRPRDDARVSSRAQGTGGVQQPHRDESGGEVLDVAYAAGGGQRVAARASWESGLDVVEGVAVGDSGGEGREGGVVPGRLASESGAWPPGFGGDFTGIPSRLWPAIEPGVRVLVDGVSGGVVISGGRLAERDATRVLGNAVVPQQAAAAIEEMMAW